jgi:hypothetical protein
MGRSVLAWHFVESDRKLRYDSRELTVEAGHIYSVLDGPLVMCQRGVHASRKPLDALDYAPGPVVCRVRCWGDIQEQGDKLVCRNREVLWLTDAGRLLHDFAVWCVRNTHLKNGKTVWDLLDDPRSRKAVETKELWLTGKATDSELAAAWDAAWDASGAAAWAASRAAAWDAAWAAARDAAWGAAGAAAWGAAGAAAWAAAGDAAWAAQNKQLGKMLQGLHQAGGCG